MSPRTIHRLYVPLLFPAGLSPGETRESNLLSVARDGAGRAVLRGSALAGALRHAWVRFHQSDAGSDRWFGHALEDQTSWAVSRLKFADCVVDVGDAPDEVLRTHNAINRHTGAVLNKGLFSLQALPPGSRVWCWVWLHDGAHDAPADSRAFLGELVTILGNGLTLGGHAARGLGRAEISGEALYREFDLTSLDDHAAYLDEHRRWRQRQSTAPDGEPIEPQRSNAHTPLRLELELTIPSGEDLLVGGGSELDCDIEPQRVTHANGTEHWLLPGSSLRGVFRAWITRLAARAADKPVSDSLSRHANEAGGYDVQSLDGNALAWGFDSGAERERNQKRLSPDHEHEDLNEVVRCPIMRLFGSGYSKGRLHVSDALCEEAIGRKASARRQRRAHVAVDRLTGGASEGFFFDSAVLVGAPQFRVVITLTEPTEDEARWLYSAVRALDLGVLRVGSSKAGGRLGLRSSPVAHGPHADLFSNLRPGEL